MDISEIRTEWAEVPYGVLGAARPNSNQRFDTFEEVAERTDRNDYGYTPAYRKLITIDGVEFHTNWTRRPTQQQLVDHPKWPTEIEITH